MPTSARAWFSPVAGLAARPLASVAVATLLLSAAAPCAVAANLLVQNAWMRFIVPSRPAAGYFVLRNDGTQAQTLVGASSPACGSLMLHRSLHQDGTDRMVMVPSVPLPPHGRVTFAPGGYHLMCMAPSAAVRPGKTVPVTLHFEDGATLTTNFPVRGATGR